MDLIDRHPNFIIRDDDVSASGNRFDHVAIVAQDLAEHRHLEAQVALLDDHRWSDIGQDLLLGDHPPTRGDQERYKIEGAATHFAILMVAPQPPALGHERVVPECKNVR